MRCGSYLISRHPDYSSGNDEEASLICHALCVELRPSKTDGGDLVPDIIALRLQGALNLGNGMKANGQHVCACRRV